MEELIAKRYVKALLEISSQKQKSSYVDILNSLSKAFDMSEVKTIINSPIVSNENKLKLILDAIEINDEVGSIYHIPSCELTGYGLNSGGAHEIGVLQCFDILELMGRDIPKSSVLGIIPEIIDVEIGLSNSMINKFDTYLKTLVGILEKEGIKVIRNSSTITLSNIIEEFRNPKR